MTLHITLEYRRLQGTTLSTGRITTNESEADTRFDSVPFPLMLRVLTTELARYPREQHPDVLIFLQRTDREGISPYALDQVTVDLLRDDPAAGIASFTDPSGSPSGIALLTKQAFATPLPPVFRTGNDALSDTFGEVVFFRVRGVDIECPGCGFWSPFTSSAMLNDPDRVGTRIATNFGCKKKCKEHFPVNCMKEWGSVRVEALLKTPLEKFYLPRAWNNSAWVSRATLTQMYNDYKKEKEKASS